jgi:monoamine oxidase
VETYPHHHEGDLVLRLDGRNRRYRGLIPKVGPGALLSLGLALRRLDRLTRRLPLDAPWEARGAARLDATTLGGWLASRRNLPSAAARTLMRETMTLLFCVDPAEVSLLGALVLARGGDGFSYYLESTRTETHLVDGGVPQVADRLAASLDGRVHRGAPVRRVEQRGDAVDVTADSVAVHARRVLVATPPALADHIEFDPVLPAQSGQLLRSLTAGTMLRVNAVYDRPFWWDDGLCGETLAPGSALPVTIDQTARGGEPGVLSAYAFGPRALDLARLDARERRDVCLRSLADRFGAAACVPGAYLETDWSAEPWSRGGMIAHFAPGVLTTYGPALRRPVGRVHWASSELATTMHGLMEGAVRSGEAAADEILDAG